MNSTWTIFVQKKEGEKLRHWLMDKLLLDRNLKIESENENLFFPCTRELQNSEKEELQNFLTTVRFEFRTMPKRESEKPMDLFSALKNAIPEIIHEKIPKSYDIIGEIVIIEVDDELEPYQNLIGQTLLDLHPSIKSVYKKLEPIKGEYRLRNVRLIAGLDNSITIHKENKCLYELDIKKVYFSSRLATEHSRINSFVKEGEYILDMFAGIGPFAILLAKSKHIQVLAVDLNPDAIYYLKRNIKLNKVEKHVTVLAGDVRELVKNKYVKKFDRVIMNLPSKAFEFLDVACEVLREGGVIHFYQFVPESDLNSELTKRIQNEIEKHGRNIKEIKEIRKVRAYAPYIWQIGLNILVT